MKTSPIHALAAGLTALTLTATSLHAALLDTAHVAFGRTGDATWQQIITTTFTEVQLLDATGSDAINLWISTAGFDSENNNAGENASHAWETSPSGNDYTSPSTVNTGTLRLEGKSSTTITLSSDQAFSANLGILISRADSNNTNRFWSSSYTLFQESDGAEPTGDSITLATTGFNNEPTDTGWLSNASSYFDATFQGGRHIIKFEMEKVAQDDSGGRNGINAMVVEVIPEPGTLALLVVSGIAVLGLARRRVR